MLNQQHSATMYQKYHKSYKVSTCYIFSQHKFSLFSDSEASKIRHKTLPVLLASELVMSDISSATLVPGRTQYLLSLTRVAFSTSVERGPQMMTQLLGCLLQCPQYEVRKLALEGVLMALQEEGEEKKTRPQWLDETTLSNLTSQAFHETHPQCLAKVRPHT